MTQDLRIFVKQTPDCDPKGDIAKVKELSSKSFKAVSFSEENALVYMED